MVEKRTTVVLYQGFKKLLYGFNTSSLVCYIIEFLD